MSYCRLSDDCDVYIFSSGGAIECYIAPAVAYDADVREARIVAFEVSTPELDMIAFLHSVMAKGIRVPARAIVRLYREAQERTLKLTYDPEDT